jgi:hypothetical protein
MITVLVHIQISSNFLGRIEFKILNKVCQRKGKKRKERKDSYCHAQQWPSETSLPHCLTASPHSRFTCFIIGAGDSSPIFTATRPYTLITPPHLQSQFAWFIVIYCQKDMSFPSFPILFYSRITYSICTFATSSHSQVERIKNSVANPR